MQLECRDRTEEERRIHVEISVSEEKLGRRKGKWNLMPSL